MRRPRGPTAAALALAALTAASLAPSRASADDPLPLATSPSTEPAPPPLPPPTGLPPLPPPSASGPVAPSAPAATPPNAPRVRPIPPPAPCACDTDCSPCQDKPRTPGSFVVGVRLQSTQTDAPALAGGAGDAFGVSFAGRFESHNDESGLLASRGELGFGLGGGTGGVEGLFGGAVLVGVRVPIARRHAPFLRVGLAGEYQGNARYLWSRFDLPLGEAGYQYVRGETLIEAGARLSPVLTGRLRAESATRVLSSAFSFGGFVTARTGGGRVDLLYTRVQTNDGLGRPVDAFQGLACWLPFNVFAVCLDGQLLSSTLSAPAGPLGAAYVGGLLGLGTAGTRDR